MLCNDHDGWNAVRRVAGTNLYLLIAGSANSQGLTAATILLLRGLLDRLSPKFDWVLMDSPPILLGADIPLLARVVDGVLLVVRGHRTRQELLEKAQQMLGKECIVGAVLNGVEPLGAYYKFYYKAYDAYHASSSRESSAKPTQKKLEDEKKRERTKK